MRRRFRRRSLRGLGAVEGEKVEYFLPASIVNAIGGGKAIAFCHRNVEEYLPLLEYKSKVAARKAERAKAAEAHYSSPEAVARWGAQYEELLAKKAKSSARSAKTRAKAGDIFSQTADEMRKDIAAIRAQGITGPIPVCVYRTTGKYGDRLKTAEKRANVHHERFHAEARREEYRQGAGFHACDANIAKVMGADLNPSLVTFSRIHWSPSGRAAAEEILARAEEVIHACNASEQDCGEVTARINDWFISKKRPELAMSFAEAVAAVKHKHSTPLAVFRAACKVK